MSVDPAVTDPNLYTVVFENDRVRVLEYRDRPGDRTQPHRHPDTVMFTLSTFRRRLYGPDGTSRDVTLQSGTPGWLPAQQHAGHNIGDTATHVLFVELKDGPPQGVPALGPTAAGIDPAI